MLASLSPARRRVALGAAALAALAVLGVVVALVLGSRSAEPVAQDDLGPVLLVAGYGGSTDALLPLRDALVEDGRRVVVVPPVGDNTGSLDDQAEALGELAEESSDGAGSVDVVGYSNGGVVARLWVREHGGDALARRVMTIGSPHHGSDLAGLAASAGRCTDACAEVAPGSAFLQRLNAGDETPDGPRWVSVWSTNDQVATPPDTASLDGALDLSVQSLCPASTTSHGELPADPVVLALLDSALGRSAPTVPAEVDCG